MLFLDRVYVEHPAGAVRFRWVNAPTSAELTELAQRIAQRVGRYLERQGLLQRDAQTSYLAGEVIDEEPMSRLFDLRRRKCAVGTVKPKKEASRLTATGLASIGPAWSVCPVKPSRGRTPTVRRRSPSPGWCRWQR
jgi:hypothetical protein